MFLSRCSCSNLHLEIQNTVLPLENRITLILNLSFLNLTLLSFEQMPFKFVRITIGLFDGSNIYISLKDTCKYAIFTTVQTRWKLSSLIEMVIQCVRSPLHGDKSNVCKKERKRVGGRGRRSQRGNREVTFRSETG